MLNNEITNYILIENTNYNTYLHEIQIWECALPDTLTIPDYFCDIDWSDDGYAPVDANNIPLFGAAGYLSDFITSWLLQFDTSQSSSLQSNSYGFTYTDKPVSTGLSPLSNWLNSYTSDTNLEYLTPLPVNFLWDDLIVSWFEEVFEYSYDLPNIDDHVLPGWSLQFNFNTNINEISWSWIKDKVLLEREWRDVIQDYIFDYRLCDSTLFQRVELSLALTSILITINYGLIIVFTQHLVLRRPYTGNFNYADKGFYYSLNLLSYGNQFMILFLLYLLNKFSIRVADWYNQIICKLLNLDNLQIVKLSLQTSESHLLVYLNSNIDIGLLTNTISLIHLTT